MRFAKFSTFLRLDGIDSKELIQEEAEATGHFQVPAHTSVLVNVDPRGNCSTPVDGRSLNCGSSYIHRYLINLI